MADGGELQHLLSGGLVAGEHLDPSGQSQPTLRPAAGWGQVAQQSVSHNGL